MSLSVPPRASTCRRAITPSCASSSCPAACTSMDECWSASPAGGGDPHPSCGQRRMPTPTVKDPRHPVPTILPCPARTGAERSGPVVPSGVPPELQAAVHAGEVLEVAQSPLDGPQRELELGGHCLV